MGIEKIGRLIGRYWAVCFFPGVTTACIYADWNHTRLWKKELTKQKASQLNA